MNNPDRLLLLEVVNAKVQGEEMFTAFDITLVAQDRIKKQNRFDATQHRHRHMKETIHDLLSEHLNGSYNRVLMDVGAPEKAWVYYPNGADPTDYQPLPRHGAAPHQSTTVSGSASGPHAIPLPSSLQSSPEELTGDRSGSGLPHFGAADDPTIPSNVRAPDARGTLCIPAKLLRDVGLNAGDKAYVFLENDQLLVCKQSPASSILAHYTVDDYGNVRITKHVLSLTPLTGQTSFSFQQKQENVLITSFSTG